MTQELERRAKFSQLICRIIAHTRNEEQAYFRGAIQTANDEASKTFAAIEELRELCWILPSR